MHYVLVTIVVILLHSIAYTQPISHQNWQQATITSGAISTGCAELILPFEKGSLLVEANPTVARGEMDSSLRSPHPVKIELQPESGTSDTLTTVSDCNIDGSILWLSTQDVGDIITIEGGESFSLTGDDIIIDSPFRVHMFVRKSGTWVHVGGGSGSGGGIETVLGCSLSSCNELTPLDGAILDFGNVSVEGTGYGLKIPESTDCQANIDRGSVCLADDDTFWVGNGTVAVAVSGAGGLGGGDITQVGGCTTGACTSIVFGSTHLLDMSAINPTDGTIGLVLPQSSDDPNCSDNVGEGSACWGLGEESFFIGNDTSPVKIGPLSLQESFEKGGSIFSANSRSNAFFVGSGDETSADGMLHYTDETGPKQECVLGYGSGSEDTCDIAFSIASGDDFILNLNGTTELTIASNGTATLGSNMKERRRLNLTADMLSVDGTHCIKETAVSLGSEIADTTITCAADDAATIKRDFPADERWDEATLTITAYFFQDDASPDGNYKIDWSGYCSGHNDPYFTNSFASETANGAMTFAASGVAENDLIIATTTGQVPIGSCSPGDMVRIRGQIDATATTATTPEDIHLLWIRVEVLFDTW